MNEVNQEIKQHLNSKYKISLIGGDMRNVKLCELLCSDGHRVHTYALENTGEISRRCFELSEAFALSDIVIGPIPFTVDNGAYLNAPFHSEKIETGKIYDKMQECNFSGILIGGNVPSTLQSKNYECEDLLKRDDLAILNSVPTAEGALQIAMEELPYTIHGLNTLVCGMGRVGSTLARLLKNVGANVTVASRKSKDFAVCEAEKIKYCKYSELPEILKETVLIYNTVPARIFDCEILKSIRHDALLIDLASMPGGVDFDYAAANHIRTIHALSLPGKVAPVGAAQIIQKVIYNILSEKNIT